MATLAGQSINQENMAAMTVQSMNQDNMAAMTAVTMSPEQYVQYSPQQEIIQFFLLNIDFNFYLFIQIFETIR